MAKHDALKNHIELLRNAIPELKGVLLASNEGLPIAHSLSNGGDPNRVAAMAAAASTLGRRISDTMSTGALAEVSIRGDDGRSDSEDREAWPASCDTLWYHNDKKY